MNTRPFVKGEHSVGVASQNSLPQPHRQNFLQEICRQTNKSVSKTAAYVSADHSVFSLEVIVQPGPLGASHGYSRSLHQDWSIPGQHSHVVAL